MMIQYVVDVCVFLLVRGVQNFDLENIFKLPSRVNYTKCTNSAQEQERSVWKPHVDHMPVVLDASPQAFRKKIFKKEVQVRK